MNPFVRAPQWSREASLEVSELPLEGVPDLSWLPSFPDFPGQAAARTVEYQAVAFPVPVIPPHLSWAPTFPDFARAPERTAEYPALAAPTSIVVPDLSWAPTFPDFARAPERTAEYPASFFVALALPQNLGDRMIAIHTPDEIPIGSETRFSVEYDIGGVPTLFDSPPDLRIYHLDLTTGAQVTDLAAAPMTQYAGQPAYHRAWTPSAKGVYILEVIGFYLGSKALGVLTVTVRPKFDPLGLAIDDVLVARNGDVQT